MPVGYGTSFVPTQLRKVTNLNPSGSGSLHEALTTPAYGAGVIVTTEGLSGSINRINQPDIQIDNDRTTLAGDNSTVTLIGSGFRVKCSDFEMRQFRTLPGDEPGIPSPDNRDAIGIEGNVVPQRIRIRNCTLGWSIDGLIDIWPGSSLVAPKSITIEDCILAEALANSLHSSGTHSTAILLGPSSTDILLARNLISGITHRGPAIHAGSNVSIVNQLYYNTESVYELYDSASMGSWTGAKVDLIGNHCIWGPSSPWWRAAPGVTIVNGTLAANTKVYYNDNINSVHASLLAAHANYANLNGFNTTPATNLTFTATANNTLPAGFTPMASSAVKAYVLANAGPTNRTVFENRIVAEVANGTTGSIKNTPITSEKEYFGFPAVITTAVHMKGWDTV